MNNHRVLAAFCLYAALGLFAGAAVEGVGISIEKGDVTLAKLLTGRKRESREQVQRVVANTVAAAGEVRYWLLPVLLAVGLGVFFAHTEYRDGTAFHFDEQPDPTWDTYNDD